MVQADFVADNAIKSRIRFNVEDGWNFINEQNYLADIYYAGDRNPDDFLAKNNLAQNENIDMISFIPSTDTAAAKIAAKIFRKWYRNQLIAIDLGTAAGIKNLEVNLRLKEFGIESANPFVAVYDTPPDNMYFPLPSADLYLDSRGYQHIVTSRNGVIVISDDHLVKR